MPRKIPTEIFEEVKRLTSEGYTQEQIENRTQVSVRTQRRWLMAERSQDAKESLPIANEPESGSASGYVWPDISAQDLVDAGFDPDLTPMILASLGIAREQGNKRLSVYVEQLMGIRRNWKNIPEPWWALIAGFPIVAQDLGAPSFQKIASIVAEVNPYLGRQPRLYYHRRIRAVHQQAMIEAQAYLQQHLLTVVNGSPPALVGHRYDVVQYKSEYSWLSSAHLATTRNNSGLHSTWEPLLFDILSRLPDPDRQRGKVYREVDLTWVLFSWCSATTFDTYFEYHDHFDPQPNVINMGYNVSELDNTLEYTHEEALGDTEH